MSSEYEKHYRLFLTNRVNQTIARKEFGVVDNKQSVAMELVQLHQDFMTFIQNVKDHEEIFAAQWKARAENEKAVIDEAAYAFVIDAFQLFQRYQEILKNMKQQGLIEQSFDEKLNLLPTVDTFLSAIEKVCQENINQKNADFKKFDLSTDFIPKVVVLGGMLGFIAAGFPLAMQLNLGFGFGLLLGAGSGVGLGLLIAVSIFAIEGLRRLAHSYNIALETKNPKHKHKVETYVNELTPQDLVRHQLVNTQRVLNENAVPADIQKIYSEHPPKVAFFAKSSVTFDPNFPPAYAPPTVN